MARTDPDRLTPAEAEQLERDALHSAERAWERGDHEAEREAADERAARMREWDIATGDWHP